MASAIIIVTIPRAEGCYILRACLWIHDQRFYPHHKYRKRAAFIFPFTPIKSVLACSPRRKVRELKHRKQQRPRALRNKVCPRCSWTVRREEPNRQAVTVSCRSLSSFQINIKWHFWDGAHTSNWALICLGMHVKRVGLGPKLDRKQVIS